MSPYARFLAAGALAAAVTGCTAAYEIQYYSASGPTNVDLSCRQSFQIFENAGYRRILVKPYPASEAAYLACAAISKEEIRAELPVRATQAVERYFERAKRTDCRTTGSTPVGITGVEVTYDCTPRPAAANPAAAKPAAPRRG
jgi:hypothetical protein